MKYIKKIILENFQSHKYTDIELDKGLNVVVGPSDHGKTAIIRGLKWVLFNEPSGDFFIREGESECSVTIVLNDGTKIKRYRGKNKNSYHIYNHTGEETIFEGIGTKVPQEVIDKTSIRKIMLDSNQSNLINISEQLEGAFLLSEKNAIRANAIGRLVGVHIIDYALKDALRDIRNLGIRQKSHEVVLNNLKKDLAEFEYLDDLIVTTNKLKTKMKCISISKSKLDKLVQFSNDYERINKDIELYEGILLQLKDFNIVEKIVKELILKTKDFNNIFNQYNRLIKLKREIKYNEDIYAAIGEIGPIDTKIDKIIVSVGRLIKLNKFNQIIEQINNQMMESQWLLDNLREIDKLNKYISLIEKLNNSMKQMLHLKNVKDGINKSISIGEVYIDRLSMIDIALELRNTLELKNLRLQKLIDLKKRYDIIIINQIKNQQEISIINKHMDEQIMQYKNLLGELEICPLCFSDIDKHRIDRILDRYK